MLIFTNRAIDPASAGPAAFTRRFSAGSTTLGMADVTRQGASFALGNLAPDASDDALLQRLVALFGGNRPLLLYVHGNNNTPATCFERCARLQEIYGVELMGFSWPSEGYLPTGIDPAVGPGLAEDATGDGDERALREVRENNREQGVIKGKIARYRQANANARDGADALARLLRLVATARLYADAQPVSLAVHSLGAYHLQHSLNLPGVPGLMSAHHNVLLLAPCCRAVGHEAWVSLLRPRLRTYVTFNRSDTVLYGASIADRGEVKLGAEPGAMAALPSLRYIDFTGGVVGAWGHGYFVRDAGKDVPKWPKRLFGRLFASESDLGPNEPPRKVYVMGCRADGTVCWMTNTS